MVRNIIISIELFQAPNTEFHFILMNLIISELAISMIGVPLDLVGTITHGKALDSLFCPIVGFTHTLFGKHFPTYHFTSVCTIQILSFHFVFDICHRNKLI